jgi:tRNA modification GTPase
VVTPAFEFARPGRTSLVAIVGPGGETIDRGVAVCSHAPRSATGEDMIELTVHGSPWVVRSTIDAFCAAGARPAGPGEFTRRAVANGKLDLVQAEAVRDLVAAETAWQARLARTQADGVLSDEFRALRETLLELASRLEAELDFSDRDLPDDGGARRAAADRARRGVDRLLATAPAGHRVRDGVRVVILGPPNSGKSTLFNELVGQQRAIVSPHPGTTRDVLAAEIELAGIRVLLKDTAGVGDASDPIEREGVRRAVGAAAEADLVLRLWPVDGEPAAGLDDGPTAETIDIRSKWDLAGDRPPDAGWLPVSCVTGRGIDELVSAIGAAVAGEVADLGGAPAIAERHRRALVTARDELARLDDAAPELAAERVRAALDAVGELTGEVAGEDVLDAVFARFCIGK